MTPERVDEILKNYRANLGRCRHLHTEIQVIQRKIDAEKDSTVETLAAPKPQQITDMPHGTSISNPTEKFGIMLADGYKTDYTVELESKLAELQAKYDEAHITLDYVDSWLSGLCGRERWIVQMQVVDQACWKDIVAQFKEKYKENISKDTLKRIRDKAMEKIYVMAE